MSDRVHQDLQMMVEFLTTCVNKSDKDNRVRLKNMLEHIKGTRKLNITFGVGNMLMVK